MVTVSPTAALVGPPCSHLLSRGGISSGSYYLFCYVLFCFDLFALLWRNRVQVARIRLPKVPPWRPS